jgi:hypothetical protein
VRELSHNLQFELMKSARKRFERHLPKIVAAWLAGLYDRDRVVARAASDGLTSFLNTPEKVLAFWNKCQAQILDFAIEAIQETQDTLSDERSTTAEDSEAKYFRVVTYHLCWVYYKRLSQAIWKSYSLDMTTISPKKMCGKPSHSVTQQSEEPSVNFSSLPSTESYLTQMMQRSNRLLSRVV